VSPETYGKINPAQPAQLPCTWALQVKNGKFVVFKPKGGKTTYWTGKVIAKSVPAQYQTTATTTAKGS
jgi:hypothetical protein